MKHYNRKIAEAVSAKSADAEQIIAGIEHSLWYSICNRNGGSGADVARSICISNGGQDQDQDQDQDQSSAGIFNAVNHPTNADGEFDSGGPSVAGRLPLAFVVPAGYTLLISSISGMWIVLVDQELQLDRRGIK